MTEGIYRLAGGNIKINKLLAEFRNNAWAVQISREDYSEHDVANVLKRFIRQASDSVQTFQIINGGYFQLEEPLLTERLRDAFLGVARLDCDDSKLDQYRELLNQLPPVNYRYGTLSRSYLQL